MLSVGLDLTEIGRIEKSMKNPKFCTRVLGPEEYLQLSGRNFPPQSVAASFCAKEAFSKAVGTGLSGFDLRDVQLLRSVSGKPELRLSGSALMLAGGMSFSVSVTHTNAFAAVTVVGWGNSLRDDPGEHGISSEAEEGLRILQTMLKPRDPESNKGDYGRLFSVCGSDGMAGAAAMSALSALRCGAGIVDVALPRSIYSVVSSLVPEAVFTLLEHSGSGKLTAQDLDRLHSGLLKASACLIGCGLGKGPVALDAVSLFLQEARIPTVLDADGINLLAEHIDFLKTVRAPLILTPHPGEMARLLHTAVRRVQGGREDCARSFSERYGVTLVLKGAGTLVAAPDGRMYRNRTGNPGMAKGGSGDVLAGMIAAFAAQGIEPFSAAAGAVYLHGLAGDRCAAKLSQCAMLPTDLIGMLPELFLELGR